MSYSEFDGRGAITIGTPGKGLFGSGASASGSAIISRRNNEEANYNLYYGMIRRIQGNARQQATDKSGHFDENKFKQLYTEGLHELYQGTNELAQGKTEFQFGTSGVVGEPAELAKRMFEREKAKPADESQIERLKSTSFDAF